tara:strand:+ start:51 stop:809 length:759 start_codon:yes stop_codon:yes gene_type:complete
MIPALEPLFKGPLAPLGAWLALDDDPRPALSMAEYLNGDQLGDLLQRFAPQYASADQRGLVSLWGKYHFMRLVAPTVAASLLMNWRLPVRFDEIAVIVGDDGLPSAFQLPHQGSVWQSPPSDGFARFDTLFAGHLDVLIRELAARYKVAPKVFWSSVGHYYEWILGEIDTLGLAPEPVAQARQLLSERQRPDGTRNPLYDMVRYVPRAGQSTLHRQRKHCCIRYLLPDKALCDNCPHLDKPPAGYDPAGRSD